MCAALLITALSHDADPAASGTWRCLQAATVLASPAPQA